ncbi:site-specific integrase [Radiobacillus kanasensis]|uniref:site-specific integrase n=1 Tax=Radiobacillus kanasensis TaxID=2844358 RepID=UPI001E6318E1|nr:tyrosine-type recombinase/integrase [Radiobacillus kanasensis]UFT98135.1 site-specific integrase [Radiobacillus kanasensis]
MKLHKTKIDDEIYYYVLKNGEKSYLYRHKYYDDLGKRKEKKKSGFKTEKEAYRALLEIRAALLNGQVKKVENNQMTISQWLDIWYDTYNNGWEVSTRSLRRDVIRDHMKPLLGKYKINDLDRTTYIRMYINKLLKKYKPSSVILFHDLFRIAINAAVDDEIIPRNRFNKISINKEEEELENFLTPEELNVFLDVAKKYANITGYTLIYFLAYTGLRKGEALGLKWEDIDFKEKTITVKRTRDYYGERSPKTKNSYRTIPIDDVVVQQLEVYQKWCMETKFKFGMRLDKEKDLVFISYQGGTPCGPIILFDLFESLYKNMEKDKIKLKKITPHGLRHTHATMLVNMGIPPKTVAERLGNTVEMIYNVYSHSFKELEDKAVGAFSESLASGAKIGAK